MGCIAQVLQSPASVTVTSPSSSCCCNNIITPVDDVYVLMKQINVTILRGTIFCASDSNNEVGGTIVVATDSVTGNSFVGITNSDGEYSICVPIPEEGHVDYEVQAYCCCSCNGDFCEETPCTCSCNGE
ncbi:MAG: hypothetical protein RR894_18270 [Terrisporobacter sp.]